MVIIPLICKMMIAWKKAKNMKSFEKYFKDDTAVIFELKTGKLF